MSSVPVSEAPKEATTTELTPVEVARNWIIEAYAKLEGTSQFIARKQQKDLSFSIAKAFLFNIPLGAEAPTGTGKTLAYLIGALAAVVAKGKSSKNPLVMSTATKALQQQILHKDIPTLVTAQIIPENVVAIAKGKSNYLCLSRTETVAMSIEQQGLLEGMDYSEVPSDYVSADLADMIHALLSGKWDGDFDTYTGSRPKSVFPIVVSSETCTKKKCEYYGNCAYFSARAKLNDALIVVANHDIVLMDLLLASQEIEPTLPFADYFVVFDEGHHLPEKALKVGATDAPLNTLMTVLPNLKGIQQILKSTSALRELVTGSNWNANLEVPPVALPLQELIDMLESIQVDKESNIYRFKKGELPVALSTAINNVRGPLLSMFGTLETLISSIRDNQGQMEPYIRERGAEVSNKALTVLVPTKSTLENFGKMLSTTLMAKWLYRKERVVTLNSSPLEGADVLVPLLWQSSRAKGVAMVSATLRDIDGFSRFAQKVGSPQNTHYMALPYTFPYQNSQLIVAAMNATPKQVERALFLKELETALPQSINSREATLIIFPSWSMLKEFTPKLKTKFGEMKVRVQGDHPIKMLLASHCQAVDKGEGSILMGVATLAEGLDLPGNYCTHVAIITLPFAVPNDPVEQEIADLLGSKYFSMRSLPDATTKLIQMVGRLLRRESDVGRITLFDRRVASTSYGRQMLDKLPPFERIILPLKPTK